MIKINFVSISDFDECSVKDLVKLLPLKDLNKFNKYYKNDDKIRFLIGKIMINKVLCEEKLIGNILESIMTDSFNRPYINEDIDFNISHSGDYVIVASSKNTKVGVDIEKIEEINMFDVLNILTVEEEEKLKDSKDPVNEFYDIWTLKEAVLKANGKGLNVPLKQVIISDNAVNCENETWFFLKLNLDIGYSAHLAFKNKCHKTT